MTLRSSESEEIQAAIAKLERLKSLGSDGHWRSTVSSGVASVTNEVGRGVAHHVPAPDAELIVTLHRTIDAQLALLEAAIFNLQGVRPGQWSATVARAIDLARAISGGA